MTNPVPSASIGTPYGKRGSWWSCDENSNGDGIHTGVDYPDPNGTEVVAARGGKVVYCNHGSAFGSHQLEILPGDGTRDFYAHMRSRAIPDGAQVSTGAKVGEVGSEGNVSGPHLHFERHKVATGGWSCSIVVNPQPSIDYQASGGGGGTGSDPMPKQVGASSQDMNLNGDWQLIDWESTWGADAGVIKAGDPGFTFVGAWIATITATLDAASNEQGLMFTRPIEGNFEGKGGAWQVTATHRPFETATTGGATYHVDTRANALAKGDRLRFQIKGPKGSKITQLGVVILFWD